MNEYLFQLIEVLFILVLLICDRDMFYRYLFMLCPNIIKKQFLIYDPKLIKFMYRPNYTLQYVCTSYTYDYIILIDRIHPKIQVSAFISNSNYLLTIMYPCKDLINYVFDHYPELISSINTSHLSEPLRNEIKLLLS
ncbi:MAG: hypothetical protein DRG78_00365 [Epsilonproteobacteria bacterium]|nr:MAG: hypothetical protein DRG78_00365 [Campylobacterota bacterium]